jgi:hypothetical protein
MYASAGNVTNFTGVLLRRQYKPGQKYIQLIFKTTDGLKLSLSRNIQMVKDLHEGKTYHVKGLEYVHGQKTFIHEPTAQLVSKKTCFIRNYKIIISATTVAIVAACSFSLIAAKPHDTVKTHKTTSSVPTAAQIKVDTTPHNTSTPVAADTSTAATASPSTAASTQKKNPQKTTAKTNVPSTNVSTASSATPQAAQQPAEADKSADTSPQSDSTPPVADPVTDQGVPASDAGSTP